jgi:hypothetical protein
MACGYSMSILRNHVNHDTFGFSLEKKTYMYLSYVRHLPPIMVHMGGHQVVVKKTSRRNMVSGPDCPSETNPLNI